MLLPFKESIELAGIYLSVSILLSFLGWLYFKNIHKSNFAAFYLLSLNFFFGSFHDFVKMHFNEYVISKYSFLLPLFSIFFLLLIIYLKKTTKTHTRLIFFFNIIFLFFIGLDSVLIFLKLYHHNARISVQSNYTLNDTIQYKPDVYLIIADEYAGGKELKEIFSFENSRFENSLQQIGFHTIPNSISNYNWTIYSMASMLNMNYLENLNKTKISNEDMYACADLIKENNVVTFFDKLGYTIHNNSIFDLKNHPKLVHPVFLPSIKSLFISQTLTQRFIHDLGFHFATNERIEAIINHNYSNNLLVEKATKSNVLSYDNKPKFVYSHYVMPHYPYYLDSLGRKMEAAHLMDENKTNKKDYISYLIYANSKLLELLKYIQKHSKTPPIILLMSDHGFRQFAGNEDKKYYFMNFNSIYLPNGNYSPYYDSLSNANQFRILFNSQFNQRLPILKDSTIFLTD